MIRRLLYDLVLFLLPFGIYWVYLRVAVGKDAVGRPYPWAWLFAAGLVLVATSFVLWALFEGDPAGGVYVPPRLEDGRIVPGHVVPRSE